MSPLTDRHYTGVQVSPWHVIDEGLRFVLREEVRPELLVTADPRPALLCWSAWKTETQKDWKEIPNALKMKRYCEFVLHNLPYVA